MDNLTDEELEIWKAVDNPGVRLWPASELKTLLSTISSLRAENKLLRKEVEALRDATRKVKNALAVGTWNVNPERQAFAVECSKLIQQTFDEANALAKQRSEK